MASSVANSEQSLKQKMTPPADSVDRENLRIWVAVERPSSCRLTIDILDSNSQIIRHFIDYVAPGGHYNFYWNKRDDSGALVEPGYYRFEVDDCGVKKEGKLKAEFKKWERLSRMAFDKDTTGFVLELLADSAAVSVEWYGFQKRLVGRYYKVDALLKGEYHFNWRGVFDDTNITLIPQLKPGFYVQKIIVGDFIYTDTIRFFNQ